MKRPYRELRPLAEVASDLGLTAEDLIAYGPAAAKLARPTLARLEARGPVSPIVLVSAINPTRFGEGKTTVSIGLAQGLARKGLHAALALREPSMGPVFGIKGGGTGGGRCTLEPSDRINLHFTGDLHAVTAAHNLLAALVDNALVSPGTVELDARQVLWKRAIDMNDRSLRRIVIGLGGRTHGVPREAGFDITAASEVMAILCLARGVPDLKQRLGRILVGFDRSGSPVTAGQLRASGAMAALLADAMLPNLVQSAEGVPAFVHGGPFGNIAHGCSSISATRAASAAADIVVTEAGFGFDLGAEKFFDIKCRAGDLWPQAVVLVATARALRAHGGGPSETRQQALAALDRGLPHLEHHVGSVRAFGFEPIIAINRFADDSEEEIVLVERACSERGLRVARFTGFAQGGAGAADLAELVLAETSKGPRAPRPLYPLDRSPEEKIEVVAKAIYGAKGVEYTREARADLARVSALGCATFPVCIAKTHLSLSDDPAALGRPRDFSITVRSVRVAAGAGYLLALTGDILTMPGLPARPAAHRIDLSDEGEIVGLD